MKKVISLSTLSALAALAPSFAFAAGTLNGVGQTAVSAVGTLQTVVNALIPVAFAAALLFFFWGLAQYIWGGAEEKEKGRNLMIWGVVALFIMASIWGIVGVLQSTFNVGNQNTVTVPGINTTGSGSISA
jgi:hypothetical protein